MTEVGGKRAVPHDVDGGAVVIGMVPSAESLDSRRRLALPQGVGNRRGVDDEDIVEVLVAPVISCHHPYPVGHVVLKRGLAHRVNHHLTGGAVGDIGRDGPAIDCRRGLETGGWQHVHRVVDAVLLVIGSPRHEDPAALVVRGVNGSSASNRGRWYAVIQATGGDYGAEDGGVGRVELPGLVDADGGKPVGLASL